MKRVIVMMLLMIFVGGCGSENHPVESREVVVVDDVEAVRSWNVFVEYEYLYFDLELMKSKGIEVVSGPYYLIPQDGSTYYWTVKASQKQMEAYTTIGHNWIYMPI